MFTDIRSKRVIFLAHCLLNQNSISDGTAVSPASNTPLIEALLKAQVGIVQLPCPELCCLGLDRGNPQGADSPVTVENTRIRKALQQPEANARMALLADYILLQIREYRKHGFTVLGILGVNRSPSCGIDTTSDKDVELPGMGIFMEMLARRLAEEAPGTPLVGLRSGDDVEAFLRPLGL